jgi:hypothetical protein
MPLLDSLLGPITAIIDKIIPDQDARDRAKLELIRLQGSQEMELLQTRLSAIVPRPARPIRGPAARGRASSMSCTR